MNLKSVVRTARNAALVGAGSTGLAMAQTSGSFDVSSVTTQITAAVVGVLAIGAAVVAGPKIAIKVWKWIGRAL